MPIVRQPVPDMEKETIMTDAYERAKLDDEQWEREHDTREKLEADVSNVMEQWFFETGWTGNTAHGMHEHVVMKWLDRQAAITERYWMEINGANTLASIEINKQREELQAKVDELNAQNTRLNAKWAEANAQVERLRAELDHAKGPDCDCCRWNEKVDELQAQLAQCKESYADAKNSRDRLQAQLDSAKYDCLTCDAKAELQSKVDDLQAENDEWRELYNEMSHERCDALMRVDKLKAELDEYDQTHMELPVDADGVPIRVGDEIQFRNDSPITVDSIGTSRVYESDWGFFGSNGGFYGQGTMKNVHHITKRTVEDVLRELADVARHDSEHELDDGDIDGFAAEIRELIGVCDD